MDILLSFLVYLNSFRFFHLSTLPCFYLLLTAVAIEQIRSTVAFVNILLSFLLVYLDSYFAFSTSLHGYRYQLPCFYLLLTAGAILNRYGVAFVNIILLKLRECVGNEICSNELKCRTATMTFGGYSPESIYKVSPKCLVENEYVEQTKNAHTTTKSQSETNAQF